MTLSKLDFVVIMNFSDEVGDYAVPNVLSPSDSLQTRLTDKKQYKHSTMDLSTISLDISFSFFLNILSYALAGVRCER